MRALRAAALLGALALAACDQGNGPCNGSLCGKGQCSKAAMCTDACERKIISPGDVCPAGYGCLGLNVCTGGDGGLPDFSGPRDMAMPIDQSVPQDQSIPGDADVDGATD